LVTSTNRRWVCAGLDRVRAPEVVTGFGEIWSAQTLFGYLKAQGVACSWLDAREVCARRRCRRRSLVIVVVVVVSSFSSFLVIVDVSSSRRELVGNSTSAAGLCCPCSSPWQPFRS
jgi:hypothetical protein